MAWEDWHPFGFQFGHVLSDMDSSWADVAILARALFQFGHVLSDMDSDSNVRVVDTTLMSGFNSATSFQTWIEGYVSGLCPHSVISRFASTSHFCPKILLKFLYFRVIFNMLRLFEHPPVFWRK